jgi:hypothetical protein
MRYEIGAQFNDDGVGEAEPMQDVTDEVDCSIKCELADRLVLDTLCKLVDGNQHMSKTFWCWCQRLDHIKARAREQPRWWDSDKIMSGDI